MKLNEDEIRYMKTKEELFSIISSFKKKEEPLNFEIIKNGVILPVKPEHGYKWGLGGVVSSDDVFIKNSLHPGYFKESENRFGGYYTYNKADYIDETVIYCDPIILQWGHFLVDSISRLWYAMNSNYRIAFCGYGFPEGGLSGSYLRFMELIGIEKARLLDVRKPTKFKNIIIPEMSYIADLYYTKEYLNIFDTAIKNINADAGKAFDNVEKVYFTRCQFKDNGARTREYGEKQLESIFRYNGFTIISPEKCSLDQQIYLMSHCKSFVSLSGTVAHNILFSRDIDSFIILNKTSHSQRQQYYLNEISGVKIVNIDVYKEPLIKLNIPKDTGYGPFLIGCTSYFIKYANETGLYLIHSNLYYQFIWGIKFLWLLMILPIRKIRFAFLKFKRGYLKLIRK